MITATTLKHPTIRQRLMTAHKQARSNAGGYAIVHTRKGEFRVVYNKRFKRFGVMYVDKGSNAQLVTSLVGACL